MNTVLRLLLSILTIFFSCIYVNARELCDCFGNCVKIYPREVNTATKREIKVRDGFSPYSTLEIDHKLPLCLGGTNDKSNLQALTKEIHSLKTQNDMLMLYYVNQCFMTIEEAQKQAIEWKANH